MFSIVKHIVDKNYEEEIISMENHILMLLNINLGLLVSIGVVSSLLSLSFRSIMRQRMLNTATLLFGLSALLSIISISSLFSALVGYSSLKIYVIYILTELSIISFGFATLILLYLTYDIRKTLHRRKVLK